MKRLLILPLYLLITSCSSNNLVKISCEIKIFNSYSPITFIANPKKNEGLVTYSDLDHPSETITESLILKTTKTKFIFIKNNLESYDTRDVVSINREDPTQSFHRFEYKNSEGEWLQLFNSDSQILTNCYRLM